VPALGLIGTRGTSSQQWSSSMSDALQALRRAAAASQGNRCYYCALPMWHGNVRPFAAAFRLSEPQARLLQCTAEHLHPRNEGGRNTRPNVVAACWYCNTRRHARPNPLDPSRYRQLVQRRLASGRWLVGLLGWSGSAAEHICGSAASEA
jgi:5-methylcytosine-specific restriction endonuclease McrA